MVHKPALEFTFYIVRRLLYGALVLLAVIYMTFFGLGVSRGRDLGRTAWLAVGDTVDYLQRLVHWDLGSTYLANSGGRTIPIVDRLPAILPHSMLLLGAALLIAAVVGIALGIVAARRRSSWLYPLVLVLSLIGVSLPSFFLAILLQVGITKLGAAAGRIILPVGGYGADLHLILPALVLASRPLAQIARVTSIAVTDVLGMEHVRVAQSKGLSGRDVWWRHVMRVGAIPILTTLGNSVRYALISLPVVEYFFSWEGVGSTLLQTLARQDDLMTVALTLTLGLLMVGINIVLDISYRMIDPRVRQASGQSIHSVLEGGSLLDALQDLWDMLTRNRLMRRLLGRPSEPLPELTTLARRQMENNGLQIDGGRYRRERLKSWLRGTFANGPFVIGSLILALLLAAFVFGPRIAPQNPYVTEGVQMIDGQFRIPPFEPSADFPLGSDMLGRDILSLIIVGTQQTLVLASVTMAARMALGFLLGAIAGWNEGRGLDRVILSLSEMVAALPALLFAMLLILAIGIRKGQWVFVVALGFVGWGEVMQYVRAEVISIKPKIYIESAIATGSRIGGLVFRHVLPNLLPALIAMAALEMGAVLMMLGELGFLSIFIGGGVYAELVINAPPFHYSDVPEWGALLANTRAYARSYPWTAIYPALTFFVSILGFNFFGEGVRRLVQEVGIGLNRLVNKWTLAAAALLVLVIAWGRANTGSMAYYRQQAEAFDGESALAYTEELTDPRFEYRQLGTAGHQAAAEWIASQFEELGLQPAGERSSYFQTVRRVFFRVTEQPTLTINGREMAYNTDFALVPSLELNSGAGEGEIAVVMAGELDQRFVLSGYNPPPQPEVTEEFANGEYVALLLSDEQLNVWDDYPFQAGLVVTDDPNKFGRLYAGSIHSGNRNLGAWSARVTDEGIPLPLAPLYYIPREVAQELLDSADLSLDRLERQERGLGLNQVAYQRTGITASASIVGEESERIEAANVMGYWPGFDTSGGGGGALDSQMIMVTAQYDGPGLDFDGVPYPAVNDNASGVGLMLELIRSWQETGYQPKRTFMFVAYANEGFQYGKSPRLEPDAVEFLNAKAGFARAYNLDAIVNVRGVGGGSGNGLMVSTGGSLHLVEIIERAARQVGVSVERQDEPLDYRTVWLNEGGVMEDANEAPTITVWWEGYESTARTPNDTLEGVNADNLSLAGRTLSQTLLMMGREVNY